MLGEDSQRRCLEWAMWEKHGPMIVVAASRISMGVARPCQDTARRFYKPPICFTADLDDRFADCVWKRAGERRRSAEHPAWPSVSWQHMSCLLRRVMRRPHRGLLPGYSKLSNSSIELHVSLSCRLRHGHAPTFPTVKVIGCYC